MKEKKFDLNTIEKRRLNTQLKTAYSDKEALFDNVFKSNFFLSCSRFLIYRKQIICCFDYFLLQIYRVYNTRPTLYDNVKM